MKPRDGVVTADRFARGMTFDEYLVYTASPENLARESDWWLGKERKDLTDILRTWYERARLSDAQRDAIRWLVAQPDGPGRILVISEEWSSDCRRAVPILARLAEAGGMELRVFARDGAKAAQGPRSDPAESPNADLVNEFLNEKDGQTWQSVPVAAFYTRDFRYLYHYIEFPALYHKKRLSDAMRRPKPGETSPRATWDRFMVDWRELQRSPFSELWASAAIDEMLSALHERLVVGSLA
jgi:hypothetical protein